MKTQKLTAFIAGLACLGVVAAIAGDNSTYYNHRDARGAAYDTTKVDTGACSQVQAGAPTKFNKAGNLLGMTIKNEQGETLGYVKEIVIDLENGKAPYAIMNSSRAFNAGEKLLAVPLTALHPSQSYDTAREDNRVGSSIRDHLVLNAERASVRQAQNLGENWPSVEQPSFGAQPFWEKSGQKKSNQSTWDQEKIDQNKSEQKQWDLKKIEQESNPPERTIPPDSNRETDTRPSTTTPDQP